MKSIQIKLFGAFKTYIPDGIITLQLDKSCTTTELKKIIQIKLLSQIADYKEQSLVFESALATDTEILSEDDLIDGQKDLALLPPVCGG